MVTARPQQNDDITATQGHLRALIRMLACRAAHDFVASSLTDQQGEDPHDAPEQRKRPV